MATRAIAATGEVVVNTETYVSSALAVDVQVALPAVNAGAGATVAVDAEIRFETTGAGKIEILTDKGRRVGVVPPRSQAVVVARTGTAQSEDSDWNFRLLHQTPCAHVVAGSDATTTQTLANALRVMAIDLGFMKAE